MDAERDAAAIAAWSRDDEFWRLLNSDPARFWTATRLKQEMEEHQGKDQPKDTIYPFLIRALDGPSPRRAQGLPGAGGAFGSDRLLGMLDLDIPEWSHRDAWVAIALGDRADWGKGYGSDALRVLLRFAFSELNLHRVSLNVFGYNPRALRSYLKVGFVVEGTQRERLRRDGRRWDMVFMGVLREEWEKAGV
jgi:RimJ/RimL family protein N-acetyltransferase